MKSIGKFVVVACVLALSACSGGDPADNILEVDGVRMPARMTIATANVAGSYYPVGNGIAQAIGAAYPGILVTAEDTSGSAQNIRMLDAGQVDFGLSNAAITFPAVRGIDGFEKQFPVRVVISLHSSINMVIALKSSGIKTIADLKGKSVAMGPPGGGWDFYARPIFAAHGVRYEDFRQVYEGQASAIDLLTNGEVDAVLVGGSIPHTTILSAATTHEIKYIPFDEAALDAVARHYPFIKKYRVPAGTYAGQTTDVWAVDSGTCQLLVREDADPDYVYLITKAIYENRSRIAEIHPAGREITPERAAIHLGNPYHKGAIRYFTEIGIWSEPEGSPRS